MEGEQAEVQETADEFEQLETGEEEDVPRETSEEATESPEVLKARSGGWVPKDEWEGDPEDWVSAKTFNRNGELFNSIKSLKAENSQLKTTVSETLANNNKFHEQQVKVLQRERDALEKKLEGAIDLADSEGAKEIMEEIKEVDGQISDARVSKEDSKPASNQDVLATLAQHPSMVQWGEQNKWITEGGNPKSMAASSEFATFFTENAGKYANIDALVEASLNHVDSVIAERFPERNPNRERAGKTAKGRKSTTGGINKLSMSDLTREEKSIWEEFGDTYENEDEFLKVVLEAREA